ncbi:MAG: hypothetical protein ABSA93_23045 [Streptosporangiaceae bacterium]
MAGTVRSDSRRRVSHLTLNSDGKPHTLENVLAISVLVIGIASFVIGLIVRNDARAGTALAIAAAVTGLYGLLVGLYAQMVSATREERVIIMTGLIAGFVGLALGIAHGGLG